MAQGKAYTQEQRKEILESLRPHLELGFSRSKACKLIGLDETTLCKWLKKDEALSMKVTSWENTLNTLAMANLADALKAESEDDSDKRKETTRWWAERRMKQDFSTRTEQTGADGKDLLPQPILGNVQNNNINKKDSESK